MIQIINVRTVSYLKEEKRKYYFWTKTMQVQTCKRQYVIAQLFCFRFLKFKIEIQWSLKIKPLYIFYELTINFINKQQTLNLIS